MLRLGIIGLGAIATKAYLPLLAAQPALELHLCSRNVQTLQHIAAQYRIDHWHSHLDSLLKAGIQAAFVHAATPAHYTLVKSLLQARIAVFVDKPLTLHLAQSQKLALLAQQNSTLLMVGFNRRYAPVYRQLKAVQQPTLILMQKNRSYLPGAVRSFVLDDFIHVVDTLRWLFPFPVTHQHLSWIGQGEALTQLTLQLTAAGGQTAIGIMNRNTTVSEERLEIMSAGEKLVALNIAQLIRERQVGSEYERANDWEPTLQRRGFVAMVDDFLGAVRGGSRPYLDLEDALLTHHLCEDIITTLLRQD